MGRTRTLLSLLAAAALVATTLALTASPAGADTTVVCPPGDASDLQNAIDVADDGDTITVWGTCEGTILVDGTTSVRIVGGGPLGATLDGNGAGTVIRVADSASVILLNLTITGGAGTDTGGLWLSDDATATVDGSRIVDNSGADEGGVLLAQDSRLVITDSIVSHNTSTGTSGTGGLLAAGNSHVELRRVSITDNEGQVGGLEIAGSAVGDAVDVAATGNEGEDVGGVFVTGTGTLTVDGLTADRNLAENTGDANSAVGGIEVSGGAVLEASRVVISANSASAAGEFSDAIGGLKAGGGSTVTLTDAAIILNSAIIVGAPDSVIAAGGIGGSGSGAVTIDDLTLALNSASGAATDSHRAGGVALVGASSLVADGLMVANTGPSGGAELADSAGLDSGGLVVVLNRGTDGTGGIRVSDSATANIAVSVLNTPGNCSGFSDVGCF